MTTPCALHSSPATHPVFGWQLPRNTPWHALPRIVSAIEAVVAKSAGSP
jgi:hypothetical protein